MDSKTVHSPTALSSTEDRAGLVPSHAFSFDVDLTSSADLPPLLQHMSSPAYDSPFRHHRRNRSPPRRVKESLNAHSEYITSQDDGSAQHRINQYIIKQEIGRGSFGAVHLAVDQYGQEYAVKEFSKSRLHKRAQSHVLRKPKSLRPPAQHIPAGKDFNSPLHRQPTSESADDVSEQASSIDLIKEEIAIMKKLNHPNLVSLYEVLDDPTEDSLYMVMEMCKKGVIMKVGLDETSDPYPNEQCRCWFRELILGIEYLHAQGIVHRDIKPDNCLVTSENVLKIVDFGVSEMFERDSDMMTAKSAGSPAFLPPELCVVKHGDISGKAADIWSMGVTLYCLKYGRIPFKKSGIFELYESIRQDEITFEKESDNDFPDLMSRILEKDPAKRIKMAELREHPWITSRGKDPLLSEDKNTSELVEPPTEAEMEHAITGNMTNLMTVMKAVAKFKSLLGKKSPPILSSILGEEDESHFSQPPLALKRGMPAPPHLDHKSHSDGQFDRRALEGELAAAGVHREIDLSRQGSGQLLSKYEQFDKSKVRQDLVFQDMNRAPRRISDEGQEPPILSIETSPDSNLGLSRVSTSAETPTLNPDKFPPFSSGIARARTAEEIGQKGHAHDPLEDHLYLFIGPSTFAGPSGNADRRPSFVPDEDDVPIVSESPGAADIDIYETAYRDEIERIRARAKTTNDVEPQVYLTRRVDARLMAVSGLAGRWMAGAEEGFERFNDITNFRERKAKVTDVSRALKAAVKQEYSRRRAERKQELQASKTKAAASKEVQQNSPSDSPANTDEPSAGQSPTFDENLKLSKVSSFRTAFAGVGLDKGRQAKTSLMGLVDSMHMKGRGKSKTSKPGDGET